MLPYVLEGAVQGVQGERILAAPLASKGALGFRVLIFGLLVASDVVPRQWSWSIALDNI